LILESPPWLDSGVAKELELAEKIGIQIFYSLEEVPSG